MIFQKKALAVVAIIFLFSTSASAQCAMCRANAESNLKSGQSQVGRGLNKGILYLMSVPYLLAGAGAFIYFRNRKNQSRARG